VTAVAPARPEEAFAGPEEHLAAELARLDLLLERQVQRLRAAKVFFGDDAFRGLHISDGQVDAMLAPPAEDLDAARSIAGLTELIDAQEEATAKAARAAAGQGTTLPLSKLADTFGLSRRELDLLVTAVAPEIDLRYETLYAYVQNDVTKKRPTVALALDLLCPDGGARAAARALLAPTATLRREALLRVADAPDDRDAPLPARILRVDDRVVDHVLGRDGLDPRLLPFAHRGEPGRGLGELALPDGLRTELSNAATALGRSAWACLLCGPRGVGKRSAALAMCAELDIPIIVCDVAAARASTDGLATALSRLAREARISGAAVYLDRVEAVTGSPDAAESSALLTGGLSSLGRPTFLGSTEPWHPEGLEIPLLRFDLPVPDFPSRLVLWRKALEAMDRARATSGAIPSVAAAFSLGPGQIEAAARESAALAAVRHPRRRTVGAADVYAAARANSHHGLRRLARKIEPRYGWRDIVVPPRLHRQLRGICASIEHRHLVYSEWGLGRAASSPEGLNVLFAGPSGTGKTMAAEILARELGLDLYAIDLATVVSKYVGETEKNLALVFREAETSNAILFFDEADALFGKRSDVKDAHDRYANIEVAYLLQQMEAYRGLAILATNLSENVDAAFARRMHYRLDFPFPGAHERERIWRATFLPQAPLDKGVDFRALAVQFELSGGSIRNAALAAAFRAASEDRSIRTEHVVPAVAEEYEKLGRLPSTSDFGDYAGYLEGR
jgi:hypothetical protein